MGRSDSPVNLNVAGSSPRGIRASHSDGTLLAFSKPPNDQEKAVTVNVTEYLFLAKQQLKL